MQQGQIGYPSGGRRTHRQFDKTDVQRFLCDDFWARDEIGTTERDLDRDLPDARGAEKYLVFGIENGRPSRRFQPLRRRNRPNQDVRIQ